MNPRVAHLAIVIVAIAGAAFVAFMALCALSGCQAGLPPEPPYVEIATANTRDR